MSADRRIAILAAAFAVSNFGYGVDRDRVKEMIERPQDRFALTARLAVEDLAGHLMENDDHDEMFVKEAEGWARDIHAMGIDHYIKTYGTRNDWISMFKTQGDEA